MEYNPLTKTYETAEELLDDLKGIKPGITSGIMEKLEKDLIYWSSYRLKGGTAEVKNWFQFETDNTGECYAINVIMGRKIILNGKPIKRQTKTLKILKYPNQWIYSKW